MLFNRERAIRHKDQDEIKYLNDYFFIHGYWFQRFLDRTNHTESLRKVDETKMTIPEIYVRSYDRIDREQT